jgi:hypothetical protein
MSILLDWCTQLQNTQIGTGIRESTLVFPILEGSHLLGLALMMAPVIMYDLRLVGALWVKDPVSKVKAQFMPITLAGFFLMVSTGVLLFWSEPVKCFNSTYFRIKIVALMIAGGNALLHEVTDHDTTSWDMKFPIPSRAKFAGWCSLITWTVVIFAGRYTAYNL